MEERYVQIAVLADLHAEIAAGAVGRAVAVIILAGVQPDGSAFFFVLQNDVDDAGDRVRPILRRSTILKHFDTLHDVRRDQVDAGRSRPAESAVNDLKDGVAVAALAVDQHQRVVGAEAAQTGRQRKARHVGALGLRLEGWHKLSQCLVEVRLANARQRLFAQHLDGCCAVCGLHTHGAGAGDDDRRAVVDLRFLRRVLRDGAGGPGRCEDQ